MRIINRIFKDYKILFASILAFHICMICAVFHKHIMHPLSTMLFDRWDGLKNNFTLVTYIKENSGKEGIFKYQGFNYPFGDYVYTTDNTPLFSILFKWFCHHIYDLSEYTLAVFNYCILANIVVCGLLIFHVFKRLFNNNKIAWLSALFLPWINFQILRLLAGHFNLSLSSLILMAIALFIGWHANKDNFKKQFLYGMLMCLLSFFGFMIHGYYLVALPVFMGAMLFGSGIMKIRSRQGVRSVIASILVPSISAGISLGFITATDKYFKLRQDFASGYDWMEQKTIISLLYTRYDFNKIAFPIRAQKEPDDIERMMYLGNIGLYAVATIFGMSLISRRFRLRILSIQKDYFSNPLLAGIFIAGLVMLSMSLGENYYHLPAPAKITTPINNFNSWNIAEIIFSIVFLSLCVFTFLKAAIASWKRPDNPGIEAYNKVSLFKTAIFYLLSAIILYLLFGRYNINQGLIVNKANPLWLLHQFTRTVEQFRSLSRFAWPFYWTFYIWLLYTVARLYHLYGKYGKVSILSFITFLGVQETIDYAKVLEGSLNQPTIFSMEANRKIEEVKINFKNYQAIIPIPYYQKGCEDYNYTIDDYDSWSAFTYNLSMVTQLPLMSCKLDRTPPVFAKELLRFVAYDKIGPNLAGKLNTKPILIAVNRKLIQDSTLRPIPDKVTHPETYEFYWKATQLTERNKLQPIDSLGDVYFFSLKPPVK